MIGHDAIEQFGKLLDEFERDGLYSATPPRKPTREELIDAAIANLVIDRPGMTGEDCQRLKEELLNGE